MVNLIVILKSILWNYDKIESISRKLRKMEKRCFIGIKIEIFDEKIIGKIV